MYYKRLKYIKNDTTLKRNKTSFEYESSLFVYWMQNILVCEGCNGNPLQYSFREGPMDGGAW